MVPILKVPRNNLHFWHYFLFGPRTKIQYIIWSTGDNSVTEKPEESDQFRFLLVFLAHLCLLSKFFFLVFFSIFFYFRRSTMFILLLWSFLHQRSCIISRRHSGEKQVHEGYLAWNIGEHGHSSWQYRVRDVFKRRSSLPARYSTLICPSHAFCCWAIVFSFASDCRLQIKSVYVCVLDY